MANSNERAQSRCQSHNGPSAATRRDISRRAAFVVLYNFALLIFLALRPVTSGSLRMVDDFAQAIGPWIAAQWVFVGLFRGKDSPRARQVRTEGAYPEPAVRRWALFWVGMGSLCYAIGQTIWTFYECVLRESPQPSLADLFYFGVAPCFMAGILMLPARPVPAASRTRIVLDGMVIMTTAITFSWYFLVGPMLLDARAPMVARILGAIYAMQPYLLVYSLLRLSARSRETMLRPAVKILSAGLLVNVITDSVYGYLLQHNAYQTGSILDAGFPLGMMLMFLGAYAARRIDADRRADGFNSSDHDPIDSGASAVDAAPAAARSLLPYAVVPIVWAFALFLSRIEHSKSLAAGVYLGAGILVVLTLLRQSFAFLENSFLYNRLHEAYDTLADSNRRAVEHAESMRRINAELKAVQNELVQSAKLASLGTLSTGVAHELNQPLAVIRGMVQQLRDDPLLPAELAEDMALIESQTGRMMKIILHLRTFARASSDDHRPVDINQVAQDCFILVGAQLKSAGIEVDLDLAPDNPRILGDANELEQVLLNLITNAKDALEERPDPRLSITIRAASGGCTIVCADNGAGIPDDIAAQVFDPFFTTKDPGKGTGLGLSISHSIIRKHHGTIQVENSGGAVFTIALPLAEGETSARMRDGHAASRDAGDVDSATCERRERAA